MRIFFTLIFALSAALLSTLSANASQIDTSCAYGAYRSPAGDLVAVTPPLPRGRASRFTSLDGRRGNTDAADSPLHCERGAFIGKSASGATFMWRRLAFRETPVTFMSVGTTLHGLLLEPAAVKKPPLIVFVHGSERQSPLKLYYQLLYTAQGVATFFYDKRGTGQSKGAYTQDFMLLAQDAANAARTARTLAAGRFSRLGFFGGSQGGWVAPLAALAVHADFLEVGFGCVCTPLEQDQWQVDYQLVHEDGFSADILPEVHRITNVTAQVMGSRSPDFSVLRSVKSQYSKRPWFSKIDGQYSGDLLKGNAKTIWIENNRLRVPWHYSGLSTLQRLTIPQLWAFAQNDSIAPSANSIARLKRLNASCAVRSIVVFSHTDHGIRRFHVAADGSRIPEDDLGNGYLRLLADFAKGRTNVSGCSSVKPAPR